jgi:imidazolonepropionase-like amidohydrolase
MRTARNLRFQNTVLFGVSLALLFFLVSPVVALAGPGTPQERRGRGRRGPPATQEKKEEKPVEIKGEKKDDRYFALKGGDVYTVTGPVLKGNDILVKNGVIERIGKDLPVPEKCEVLDVEGMRVYPGLIAVSSSSILGSEPPEHSTDVYGLNMVLALAGGLTTVVTGNTAAKLTYGTTEGMVVKRNIFASMSYQRRSPTKRQELRLDLERVRRYMRDLGDYEVQKSAGHEGLTEPDKKWLTGKYANYLTLLKGESVAKMALYTAQEILDACELASQFGFRLVIEGGTEAWTVADIIGRAGVQMIFTPRRKQYADTRRLKPSGWNIESARILHEHGVTLAILPESRSISLGGMTGRDLIALPMEAAFAVRGGLPDQAAIEAITIDAAKLLGLENRLGSIETGKDGDFVVCDGDLLHYNTLVEWTIVNGRIAYDKQKESLFAHIRPRDGSSGKVIEFWPRPADTMPDFD